jgi:type IV secretion system protein VirD4
MNWYYYTGAAILLIIVCTSFETKKSPVDALFGEPSEHLSMWAAGFCPVGGLKALSVEQSYRNCLVTSATGGGKSSASILGSLFTLSRAKSSCVVLDVSSELYKLSSGYLSKHRKRKIYCFDPLKPCDGFNPLAWCKTITDIDKVAHVIIKNGGVESKSDSYWQTSSQMVFSFFLQYVFFFGKEHEKNIATAVELIDTFMSEPQKIDALIIKTDARLLRVYKTICVIPEKTRQSILSTVISATKLFRLPEILRCTSTNTFTIENLRNESSVLYLCIPLHMIHFLAPLTAVLFELLFQESLSRIPSKKELPIWFLIDEMLTMKLDLPLVFSNGRKYKIGIMGILQSMEMLSMKYNTGECFAIKSNACTLSYLPGQTIQTCRELQEIIGKCVMKDEQGREKQVYGMETAQIRQSTEALVLINSSLPLRLPVIPYFKNYMYNARTKIPPYMPAQRIPSPSNTLQ